MNYETLNAKYGEASEKPAPKPEGEGMLEEILPPEKPLGEVEPEQPEAAEEPAPVEQAPAEADAPRSAPENAELQAQLQEQKETLAELSRKMELLDQKLSILCSGVDRLKQAPVKEKEVELIDSKLDALHQAQIRLEKANVDILRDSKNFQASVREKMQKELDGYHKLHSEAAFAPILTDIANLFIMSSKSISFITNEKERKNVSEIVLEGLLEILEEQGVTVNSTPVGEKRSIKTCKTRKTIPTGDASLHGMVAESINPSFALGNQVLIKESIDTYVFDATLIPASDASANPNADPSDALREPEAPSTGAPAQTLPDEPVPADVTPAPADPAVPAVPAAEEPVENEVASAEDNTIHDTQA